MPSREQYVDKNIKNVPAGVRQAVIAEALERGVTISDVVGEALAGEWDIEYVPSGLESVRASLTGTQFTLLLPQEVVLRIYMRSRATGMTESSVVLDVLARRYDEEYEPAMIGGGGSKRRRSVSA